jgi:hypothetical protein
MRVIFLLFLAITSSVLLLPAPVSGQAQHRFTFPSVLGGTVRSMPIKMPLGETAHFVAVSLRCKGAPEIAAFELRTAGFDGRLGAWQTLHDDHHATLLPGQRQFAMLFLPVDTRVVQFRATGLEGPVEAEVFFFSPVNAPEKDPAPVVPLADRNACPCPQPAYVNRAGWGGPPAQQPGCTPAYTNVTHLVVHHQAGAANPPYSATVQAIWQLHVNTNGWCDIGYNWLIAPDGTVFEGRAGGNNVIGAHFSGNNSNTMGVCFLGNFQNDQPTAAALASLEKLLAWKCCDSNIEPTGTSLHAGSGLMLNHICGHRDGGSTLCPGDNLYAKLPVIRPDTDSLYHDPSGCDGIWPPANDACADAALLVSAETCEPVAATTDGASASGVPIPACSGFTSGSALDVWFRFTAIDSKHHVTVTPLGPAPDGLDPVVALYDADCAAPQLIQCIDAPGGPGGLTILNLENLTPGQQYRIRVFDFGNAPAVDGRFNICVLTGASVGIAEAGVSGAWRIYPNPATGWVTVQLPETFSGDGFFRLLNIGGIPVREIKLTQREARVDLAGLPAGVYLAELQTAAGMSVKRVVLH